MPLLDLPREVAALIARKATPTAARAFASTSTTALHAMLDARADISFNLDLALARCFSAMTWQYGGWQNLVVACTTDLPPRPCAALAPTHVNVVLCTHLQGSSVDVECHVRVNLRSAVLICADAQARAHPAAPPPLDTAAANLEATNLALSGALWTLTPDAWRLVQRVYWPNLPGNPPGMVILPRRMERLTYLVLVSGQRLGRLWLPQSSARTLRTLDASRTNLRALPAGMAALESANIRHCRNLTANWVRTFPVFAVFSAIT